ncbi:zinc finger protein 57-like [Centruroides vittatus]|uniref:zinc finger protein 57-like n=1 Tax=Centruroides vittatus TaxID=120091 RepID=UPI00350F1667
MHVFEFSYLKEKPYRREYCGKMLITASALQQHINNEQTRQSKSAGSSVSFKYKEYKEFLMDVFDNERYRCQYCGRMFKSELELQDHINKEHSGQNNGVESDGLFKYEKTLMGVFDDEVYKCTYCGMLLKSERELREHIKEWHPNKTGAGSVGSFKYEKNLMGVFDDEVYKCTYCGMLLKSERELREHIKEWHPNKTGAGSDGSFKYEKNLMGVFDDEVYKCTYCGMLLKSERELREHIKEWHPNKTGAGSDGSFKYEKNLMGVFDDEVYKCTYCGMLLKSERELREHIKQWHPNKTGSGSDGSFKYEEYGITRSEPFNVDHSIILYDSTFCEMFAIFEKLGTVFENFKELKSQNKPEEECFRILKKSKNEEDIKGQGAKNKQSNEAKQKQDPAGDQKVFSASADKNPEIGKSLH